MTVRDKLDLSQHKTVQNVRLQIVNAVLIVGSLIGTFSLVVSLYTTRATGWQNENVAFIIVLLLLVGVTIFRNRLSYHLKTIIVLACVYSVGLFNLVGWGLISSASIWFITTVLLTMIFHDTRSGIIAYVLVAITLTIAGLSVQMNLLHFDIDFNAYGVSGVAWLSRIIVTLLVSALIVTTVGRVLSMLRQQLEESHQRRYELAVRSQELTIEIEKREEAELALANLVDHLKDLDHLKDQFIDSVSHELRTPIANIQLYHQLLGMRPDKKDEYLKTLKKETGRLSHVVEQMIYASGEESALELSTMIEIDLYQVTIGLFNRFQDVLADKNVRLILPEVNDAFIIQASPEHLERAVINLVDNAVKYTPQDGEISLSMLRKDSGRFQLVGVRIQNTGECPSEQERDRLFDRFVRGEVSLKMGVPGAGLGLSISRQIAEKYGGGVDFTCDDNADTLTFTLWLPSHLQINDPAADTAIPVS